MISLGLDIGSVSAKLAAVGDEEDWALVEGIDLYSETFSLVQETVSIRGGRRPILISAYRRIKGEPTRTVFGLLDEMLRLIPPKRIMGIRTTGSGGAAVGR